MGVLADHQIVRLAKNGMIAPFFDVSVNCHVDVLGAEEKVISYGTSSYGYDARLAPKYELFTPYPGAIMDPKHHDPRLFTTIEADTIILPAHSYMLGYTMETFFIPKDILVECITKSTYARCGVLVNVTPLEPEWYGEITLEIANLTPIPVKIYGNEGICQLLFHRGDSQCDRTYATKSGKQGKYQGQKGVVHAKA